MIRFLIYWRMVNHDAKPQLLIFDTEEEARASLASSKIWNLDEDEIILYRCEPLDLKKES